MSQNLGADEQQNGQGSNEMRLHDHSWSKLRRSPTVRKFANTRTAKTEHGGQFLKSVLLRRASFICEWFLGVNPSPPYDTLAELLLLSECAVVWRAAWRFHRLYTRAWKHLFGKRGFYTALVYVTECTTRHRGGSWNSVGSMCTEITRWFNFGEVEGVTLSWQK